MKKHLFVWILLLSANAFAGGVGTAKDEWGFLAIPVLLLLVFYIANHMSDIYRWCIRFFHLNGAGEEEE